MARSNSWAEKRGGMIRISGDLREEITFWKFLDSFQGWSKWRGDRHTDLTLATDASGFGWGAHISNELIISDLWDKEDTRPIHIKETEALCKTLKSIPDLISDKRLDVLVDNQALVKAWENQGGGEI